MTANTNRELFLRAKEGDVAARNEIVIQNKRLACDIANHYCKMYNVNYSDREDVMQDALLSLFEVIKKYDVDMGYKFSTVAYTIIGRILQRKHFRSKNYNKFQSEMKSLDVALLSENCSEERTLIDTIPDDGECYNRVFTSPEESLYYDELDERIRESLSKLSERELHIIYSRFFNEDKYTFKQLGEELGISAERVRKIAVKVLEKLRDELEDYEIVD